ncbi:MAG: hypothetical protein GXP32_07110 [Kiritimatiellaeota bacterium]|nr:hypothetical protein [Kiritimatiellota bacterium]
MKKKIMPILRKCAIYAVLFTLTLYTFPAWWCGRDADKWFDGDSELQEKLARSVKKYIENPLGRKHFSTGSKQFDGEWLFGTYMMAGMGFGQMILEHPEKRDEYLPAMEMCVRKILSKKVRAFDKERWGGDPIEAIGSKRRHCGYLGYFNLLLSFHRYVDPESEFAELNDRITEHLENGLRDSAIHLLESYPGEVYPVDNCAAIGSIGSIGLCRKAKGEKPPPFLAELIAYFGEHYIDAETNLLIQCVDPASGDAADHPRGSGTAFGLYMLSFADERMAGRLWNGVRTELASSLFRFGGIREYPRGIENQLGDIDSGPVVFGFGASATGFAISGARMFNDRNLHKKLCASLYLAGAPAENGDSLHFVTGGPIGNAIIFAMLTARPPRGPPVKKGYYSAPFSTTNEH